MPFLGPEHAGILIRIFREFPCFSRGAIGSLAEEVVQNLHEIVTYCTAPAGHMLFREDDAPDLCYVVIAGELGVFKNKGDTTPASVTLEGSVEVRKACCALRKCCRRLDRSGVDDNCVDDGTSELENLTQLRQLNAPQHLSLSSEDAPLTPKKSLRSSRNAVKFVGPDAEPEKMEGRVVKTGSIRFKWTAQGVPADELGVQVATLGVGTLVGELALRDEGHRNASVLCLSNCDVIAIGRNDYDKLFKDLARKERLKGMKDLIEDLFDEIPLLASFSARVRADLADAARLCYREAGDVLFSQFVQPDYCYLILNGEVAILKRMKSERKESIQQGADASRKMTRRSTTLLDAQLGTNKMMRICTQLREAILDASDLDWFHDAMETLVAAPSNGSEDTPVGAHQQQLEEISTVLGTGMFFGEAALFDNMLRRATATCKTRCEFLALHRKFLGHALNQNRMIEQLPMYARPLLAALPEFAHLNAAALDEVSHLLMHRRALAGSFLYYEEDEPDMCYILLSGEVELLEYDAPFQPTAEWTVRCGKPEVLSKCRDFVDSCAAFQEDHPRCRKSAIGIRGQRVGLIGPGVVFGMSEILKKKPREGSALCRADTELLVIKNNDFVRFLAADMRNAQLRSSRDQISALLKGFNVFCAGAGVELEDGQSWWDFSQGKLPEMVRYVRKSKGATLFFERDEPDMCYIILQGEVLILKDALRYLMQEESSQIAAQELPPVLECISTDTLDKCAELVKLLRQLNESPNTPKARSSRSTPYQSKPVAVLGPGLLVGEVALMSDGVRNATAVCRTDCDFLAIHRKEFKELLSTSLLQAKRRKLQFLLNVLPKLGLVSEAAQLDATVVFKLQTFPRNHTLFVEGNTGTGNVYIVKDGSVELHAQQKESEARSSVWQLPKQTKRLVALVSGGFFASANRRSTEPCTAVVVSSRCQVYTLKLEQLMLLPEVVASYLKTVSDQASRFRDQRKNKTCTKSDFQEGSPQRLGTPALPAAISQSRPGTSARPGTSSRPGTFARPGTSSKRGSLLDALRPSTSAQSISAPKQSNGISSLGFSTSASWIQDSVERNMLPGINPSKKTRPPTGVPRACPERSGSMEEFDMRPGELMAAKGRLPRVLETKDPLPLHLRIGDLQSMAKSMAMSRSDLGLRRDRAGD